MTSRDTSIRPLVLAYAALLSLLAVTVVAAQIDWGTMNIAVAIGIAAVKTILIATVFMHLGSDRGSIRVYGFAGVFWLAIMLSLTLADYFTRASSY